MNAFEEQEYTKKLDLQLWKKLLQYTKPYKKYMMILGFVMIIVGGIDAIFPLMTKMAIDQFVVPKTVEGLPLFGIKYALLVLIQCISIGIFILMAGKVETKLCYDIRERGFRRLQELSFSYYDTTPIGWMMARMTSDIQRLADSIAWGLVDLVWGFTMMGAVAGVMLFLNWKLALIVLSVIPVLVVISVFFQNKILQASRKVRKTNSRITGAFNEGIMGAKTTKTLVLEESNLEEFKGLTTKMYHSSVKVAIFSSIYLPIVMTLGSVGTALAISFGGKGIMLQTIGYGTLVAFISYTVQFFEPIRELARIFAEFQSAQASAERVLSMIETQPDIQDEEEILKIYGDIFEPKKENWPNMKGDISFENVSFSYKEGEKVLENFNLDIKAGEKVAFVGETGSGKSTIINLACRFYQPNAGRILVDGVDYRERSQLWLQANLGYVLQTPHLFSGTLMENIRYGALEATDQEVIEAAKLVNAHSFIMKMEKQYHSEVGEGGSRLSMGEKQLISFARAILASPKIFVLDEATSSIDTETEKMIQQAIDKVLEGRTSFIIAHRLSTIRSADRIIVLKKGEIVEEGNHEELLNKGGYYYRLYTNQFKDS
ncbi:ABC transporter ATP-binding protein/permease [Irregularibacter muris]|uniref:ABC transporter ATP-binding protein/permease n=1 Tax=Irregularibacter muris TaxID=1796619 RepID=A0AAE3HG02_9FIRM|nr:ABC transporter ATP-binding protein [Irregularibacter muris]MCR1899471.1 ABC transporter ATP-binding protein/permease [Irregularibacter muris]